MAQIVASHELPGEKLLAALSAKQDELDHVARVLHENVGQVLTVVGFHLDMLRNDFSAQAPELAPRTAEIQALLEQALKDIREVSYRINPGIVPRSGLRYALDTLAGKVRESSKASIRFLMEPQVQVPLPIAVAFYELAAQSLDNAVRHSGASQIELHVRQVATRVELEVKDNGCGFDPQAKSWEHGCGLLWMRHQARRAGIDLRIESAPGQGARLAATYRHAQE